MGQVRLKMLLYAALVLLFILHNDLWFWYDASRVMGLPVGLFYHIAYCVVATLLFSAFARFAWPKDLEIEEGEPQP